MADLIGIEPIDLGRIDVPTLLGLLADDDVLIEIEAGYEYDRKSNLTYDAISGVRNPTYGHDDDAIVCRVTYRCYGSTQSWVYLNSYGTAMRRGRAQAKVDAARQQLAAAEAELGAVT